MQRSMGDMARNLPNVITNGDARMCMVKDCPKKAIYRSPARNRKSQRGYCSEHRHLALTGMTTPTMTTLLNRDRFRDEDSVVNGSNWRIQVDDDA